MLVVFSFLLYYYMDDKYRASTEQILKSYYQIAKCNTYCHEHTYLLYKKRDQCMSIPRIILTSIVGSASLGLEYIKDNQIKSYSLLGIALISFFGALIGTLSAYFGYGEKCGVHRQLAEGWNSLGRTIQLQLKQERRLRRNAKEFLEEVSNIYDKLCQTSLEIPAEIIYQTKTAFKDYIQNGYTLPYFLNGLDDFTICHTDSENNIDEDSVETTLIQQNPIKNDIELVG